MQERPLRKHIAGAGSVLTPMAPELWRESTAPQANKPGAGLGGSTWAALGRALRDPHRDPRRPGLKSWLNGFGAVSEAVPVPSCLTGEDDI